MRNFLDVSTLENEAGTLPRNVRNLTHIDAALFSVITEPCALLHVEHSMALPTCPYNSMEHWYNE
jgi:hypothetical protein